MLFSMRMFTILVTEMEQESCSACGKEGLLRVFFARKKKYFAQIDIKLT